MSRHLVPWLPVAAAVAFATPAAAAAQQAATGIVTGQVTDRADNQPLSGVQVQVVGTRLGAVSGDDGRFTIPNVPAGTVQLRALRIGYASTAQPVAVTAGGTATATFVLARAAQTLEQVTVTATGESQRVREQGNSTARVELPPERLPALPNFSSAIAGQAPGVQVLQSGGTSGTGSRIRVRGVNSLSLSNEPLIVVDGVRVGNNIDPNIGGSSAIDVGGQAPSRLDDFNPDEIESIEVLKGPAAAGLYGTQAANGVIQITTKRGRAGRTRWGSYVERGASKDVSDFPPNYGGWFTTQDEDGNDVVDIGCDLASQQSGFCTQDSVATFNPLEDPRFSPFRTGARTQYGLNVSGGGDKLNFFLSGEDDREAGVYQTNSVNRTSFRANLRAQLTRTVDATVSSGYTTSNVQLPGNDNTFLGYISNGLAGFPRPDDPGSVNQDGYDPLGPASINFYENRQRSRRAIGSVQANWYPVSWLRFNGVAGLDQINRGDTQTIPPGRILLDDETTEGYREADTRQFTTYTGQVTGTATFNPLSELTSTTTLSFQYQQERAEGTNAFGARLVAGTNSLEGAVARFTVGEVFTDNKLAGAIVSQQFGYRDRLFLSAGVRGDDNSAFGENFGTIYYPNAQVSYVVSEEPWFRRPDALTSVRLRGAFGQSGLRPGTTDALTFFNPVPARVGGIEAAAITVGGIGDPNLKPERTTEFEGGTDVTLFGDRVNLNATYYSKLSQDALVQRVIAPSVGAARLRFENIGEVKNAGVEVGLTARAVDVPSVQLDFTVNYSRNEARVVSLSGDVPEILLTANGSQRHRVGFSPGAYFGERITGYGDTDGDGIVDDIQTDSVAYLGSSVPRSLFSFQPAVTLFKIARLSALLDYRGGYKQYNSSEDFRCGILARCRGLNDITASLQEQAYAFASLNSSIYSGYIEDADFVRLREVSLTLSAPQRLATRLRTSGVSLTLAGYNLGLSTDYSGIDPEVNASAQSNYVQSDFLSQAPVRRFSARLNVNF
jgi:TonB-linked SusC/RagA family outer membrane protein